MPTIASALFIAVLASIPVQAALPKHCGDQLHSVRPGQGAPGSLVELRGSFSSSKGFRRLAINKGDFNELEAVSWSPSLIRARVPGSLKKGAYKIGIYCDGRPGPRRFLHATAFIDFNVLNSKRPARIKEVRTFKRLPKRREFETWLRTRPRLKSELVWEDSGGPSPYTRWPKALKDALYQSFRRSFLKQAHGLKDPPLNLAKREPKKALKQILPPDQAKGLYLAWAGHTLAAEYTGRVPWSLAYYTRAELEIFLDSRQFFTWSERGYDIESRISGMVIPPPPDLARKFMASRVGKTRKETIVSVLEWLRENAVHFEGQASPEAMQRQWQYSGFPPASRIIAGTPHSEQPNWPIRARVAGCFGTSGFLRAILRAANIPVSMATACAHYMPYFSSEGLYLSHGDDPYNGDTRRSRCSAEKLLIDEKTYDAWFKKGAPARHCKNIGRASRELREEPCN